MESEIPFQAGTIAWLRCTASQSPSLRAAHHGWLTCAQVARHCRHHCRLTHPLIYPLVYHSVRLLWHVLLLQLLLLPEVLRLLRGML